MIGYAPLLGQVRLTSHRLGQTTDPNSPFYDPAAAWDERIQTLVNSAKNLPDYGDILQEGNFCYAQVAKFAQSPTPQTNTDAQKCISDLEGHIQRSLRAAASMPTSPAPASSSSTQTPSPTASTASSQGIPTWALVVGSIALVGVVVYAATH